MDSFWWALFLGVPILVLGVGSLAVCAWSVYKGNSRLHCEVSLNWTHSHSPPHHPQEENFSRTRRRATAKAVVGNGRARPPPWARGGATVGGNRVHVRGTAEGISGLASFLEQVRGGSAVPDEGSETPTIPNPPVDFVGPTEPAGEPSVEAEPGTPSADPAQLYEHTE